MNRDLFDELLVILIQGSIGETNSRLADLREAHNTRPARALVQPDPIGDAVRADAGKVSANHWIMTRGVRSNANGEPTQAAPATVSVHVVERGAYDRVVAEREQWRLNSIAWQEDSRKQQATIERVRALPRYEISEDDYILAADLDASLEGEK